MYNERAISIEQFVNDERSSLYRIRNALSWILFILLFKRATVEQSRLKDSNQTEN